MALILEVSERYGSEINPTPPDAASRPWEGATGEDLERGKAGRDPEDRLRDGIDAEILFPNKGIMMGDTRRTVCQRHVPGLERLGLGDLWTL